MMVHCHRTYCQLILLQPVAGAYTACSHFLWSVNYTAILSDRTVRSGPVRSVAVRKIYRTHFLSVREGETAERTSNVAQVAVGCVLAYGFAFYGVKAQCYANYCLRRRTRATLNSVSAQYCFYRLRCDL